MNISYACGLVNGHLCYVCYMCYSIYALELVALACNSTYGIISVHAGEILYPSVYVELIQCITNGAIYVYPTHEV
jgi:hypothetical protein